MTKAEINKLDKLWREYIHARDFETCGVCNNPGNNAHHIVGRRNRTLRWDPENGIILCPLHHTFGRESAHQDPLWFSEWFQTNYPDRYIWLMKKRNVIDKNDFEYHKNLLTQGK